MTSHADAELQLAFARHLRDPAQPVPAGLDPARVATYRRLFFNNVHSILSANFPVISATLDTEWAPLVRQFYAGFQSHVPLFTELAREFVRFLEDQPEHWQARWPFLRDLAHYEWVELELMLDPADPGSLQVDPEGDLLAGRPVVSPCVRLLAYAWPVHQIRPEFQPLEAPAEPTFLLVYRGRKDQIGFMALNPVSARLLELLADPATGSGGQAVASIAAALGVADPASLWPMAQQQLQQWLERDILLGVAATGPDH